MDSPFSKHSFNADQESALSSTSTLSSNWNPLDLMQGGDRAASSCLQSAGSPGLKQPQQKPQSDRKFTLRGISGSNAYFDIDPGSASVSSGAHLLSASDHRQPSFLLPIVLSPEDGPLGDLVCWGNTSVFCPPQTNRQPEHCVPSSSTPRSYHLNQDEVLLATTRPPTQSSSHTHVPSAKFPDFLSPPPHHSQDPLLPNAASACTLEQVHEQSSKAHSGHFETFSHQVRCQLLDMHSCMHRLISSVCPGLEPPRSGTVRLDPELYFS